MKTTACLSLFAAMLAPLFGGLEIQRVIPGKIIYAPGEKGPVEVTLKNTGAESESAELKLSDVWNLDRTRPVWSGVVSLGPKETKTMKFDYDAGSETYGREIRAELLKDGKVVSEKGEFFNVLKLWQRVVMGTHAGPNIKLREKVADWYGIQVPAYKMMPYFSDHFRLYGNVGPFFEYGNHWTRWGMALSSVGKLVDPALPADAVWHTGAGAYARTNAEILRDSKELHARGFKFAVFTINNLEGPAGFELARRKPEFILRDFRGGFEGRYLKLGTDPLKLSQRDRGYSVDGDSWHYVNPDFYNSKAVDWAADALIESVRFQNGDSVYFDFPYFAQKGFDFTGADLDRKYDTAKTTRANIAHVRARLREAFGADFYIWSNGAWDPKIPESESLNDPKVGALLEIQDSFIFNPNMSYHSWRGLYEAYLSARNNLWNPKKDSSIHTNILATGYVYPVSSARDHENPKFRESDEWWPLCNHISALMMASAVHPYVNSLGFRPMLQFMTRYSELFWHEDVRWMKGAYRKFHVDGLREVWWEDSVYTRETPEYTDYYLHLINVPDSEMVRREIVNDPEPADDVEVSTKLFSPDSKVLAWALQPYSRTDSVLAPKQVELKPKFVNDEFVVAVPEFRYYTLVVIRKLK